MSDRPAPPERPRSSRRRYRAFVEDYKRRRLDDSDEGGEEPKRPDDSAKAGAENAAPADSRGQRRGKRREYLREYLRWLRPHRYAVGALLFIAFLGAGLQMVEPLFMRFMVDGVLLNTKLDLAPRLARLHLTGAVFLAVIIFSNLIGALRDYRQRLLNTRVMLALRGSLFERLLHQAQD